MEYSERAHKLGVTLFVLLSEALGLQPDHLIAMDCAKRHLLVGHYYPPCPEPELTIGTEKHSDFDFITILLQDSISALQFLSKNQWIDVPPMPGALVVNVGDFLQARLYCIAYLLSAKVVNLQFLIKMGILVGLCS